MTEPADTTHVCARDGCQTQVERRHLACPTHWGQLSVRTRNAVYAADRTRKAEKIVAALTAAVEEMNA